MAFMFDVVKGLKRVMTGEVINQIDTPANSGWATMSLRLKKERGSDELYVVLAGLSKGNYQYFAFTRDEFAQFSEGVKTIRDAMDSQGPKP